MQTIFIVYYELKKISFTNNLKKTHTHTHKQMYLNNACINHPMIILANVGTKRTFPTICGRKQQLDSP